MLKYGIWWSKTCTIRESVYWWRKAATYWHVDCRSLCSLYYYRQATRRRDGKPKSWNITGSVGSSVLPQLPLLLLSYFSNTKMTFNCCLCSILLFLQTQFNKHSNGSIKCRTCYIISSIGALYIQMSGGLSVGHHFVIFSL